MEPRITLLTLGVSDLAASLAFYRDGLGLPVRSADDSVVFFELQGTALGLFPREALAADARIPSRGSGFAGFSIAHNVGSKEEVHEVIERARAAGARIVKEPEDVFWGGYSAYFTDPDGFLWEVAWNPFWPLP